MALSPNNTHQIFSSRVKVPAGTYIGDAGRIFYHEDTGELRLSDGVTPGGLPIFLSGNVAPASGNVILVGDITANGLLSSNITATLSTVNSNVGTFGNSSFVPSITVNSKGLVTAVTLNPIGGTSSDILLIGDATATGVTGSNTTITFNAVNSNVGSFGNASTIPTFTVNSKGLVTAAGQTSIGPLDSLTITGNLIAGNISATSLTVTNTITGNISGNAGTANIAVNLLGGTAGSIFYQTAANTTASLGVGVNGQVLTLTAGLPVWSNVATSNAATATYPTITSTVSNTTFYPTFTEFTNGNLTIANITTGLSFNPSSNTLTTSNFVGNVTGTASNVITNANLVGDVTSIGNNTTLATVNANIGTFGSVSTIPVVTVNAKGLVTGVTLANVSTAAGNVIIDGDATGSGTTGSNTTITLNTVNSNVGSFGNSSMISTFAVNAKGLITAASQTAIGPLDSLTITGNLTVGNVIGNVTGNISGNITGNITGNLNGTASNVITNANLTGPISSIGNATYVVTQTGTGNVFVMNTNPTIVSANLTTPSYLLGTNITGTAIGLTAGNVLTIPNLSGDVTSVNTATTLATVNSNIGTFGSGTTIPVVTVNAKGLVTGVTLANLVTTPGNVILSGDVNANGEVGSNVTATLSTVNSNVGNFGSNSQVGTFTVNAKGLVTAAANVAIPLAVTIIGDATGSGTTSTNTAITLNTVNGNVGTFGNSSTIPVVTVNAKGLVTSVNTAIPLSTSIFVDTLDPTGHVNRVDSLLSFDNLTRIFTIAPAVSSFTYYIKGVPHVISTPKSITIPNITGNYFIYFDSSENLQYQSIFDESIVTEKAYTTSIFWNSTQGQANYFGEERHGITMDGITHAYLHTTRGTVWLSGLGISNLTVDGNGDLDAHARCGVQNGSIRDEDLKSDIYNTSGGINSYDLEQILDPVAQLPVYYRLGSADTWYVKSPDSFPMIYNGTAGYTDTLPPFNELLANNWQLTPLGNNRYFFIHIFATNNIIYPVIAVQGISEYQNNPRAQDAGDEISRVSGLPFQEFVPIATLILQTATGFLNTPKAKIVSTTDGFDYIDWRTSGHFTAISGVTNIVNQLTDLTDVTLTSPVTGQIMSFNGSQWVNVAFPALPSDEILSRHNGVISQTFNTTPTALLFDSNIRTDTNYTYLNGDVTINAEGTYEIDVEASYASTSNNITTCQTAIYKNGVIVAGSIAYSNHSSAADGKQTTSAKLSIPLVVSDVITIIGTRLAGAGSLVTQLNGCRLNIIKVR